MLLVKAKVKEGVCGQIMVGVMPVRQNQAGQRIAEFLGPMIESSNQMYFSYII